MLLMLNGERTQRWREAEERGDDGSEHDKARKPLLRRHLAGELASGV